MANEVYYELSHIIHDGMITYQGLPGPAICDFWDRESSRDHYEDGSSFQIGKIEMVANTGTYIDVPFHRFADGEDLSEVGLEKLADLPVCLIEADHHQGLAVDVDSFGDEDIEGKAVLIETNWSDHWGDESYFSNHPFLTGRAAEYLRDSGAVLVGIDSYNIDDTRSRKRPVHTALLGAGIPIVEHLSNLRALPRDKDLLFSATPARVKGMGSWPVRAYARIS